MAVRIVLLGKTGSGKSSAGNVILGEQKFEVSCGPNRVTIYCETEQGNINNVKITVTDTPGIFDTDKKRSDEHLKYSIISCLTECAPGPHAFILVLKVGRYTKEEEESVKMILKYFQKEALKHTVVLFTHGNDLEENQTIKGFVDKNKDLKELVHKCDGRVHVIDSKHWNKNKDKNAQSADLLEQLNKMMIERREAGESLAVQTLEELKNQVLQQRSDGNPDESEYRSNSFQIKQLLTTIDNMVKGNEGRCYTNKQLQVITEAIQDEINKKIQHRQFFVSSSPIESQRLLNMEDTEDELHKRIWNEARKKIRNKILKSEVAGAAVGSLLGILLGVAIGTAVPFVTVAGLLTAAVKSIQGSRSKEPELNPRKVTVVGAVEGIAVTAGTTVGVAVGATGAAAAAGTAGAAAAVVGATGAAAAVVGATGVAAAGTAGAAVAVVGATGVAAAAGTAGAAVAVVGATGAAAAGTAGAAAAVGATGAAAAGTAGAAVAVGAVMSTSVAEAAAAGAAIGAGAATGIGVGVTAGVFAIAGAVRGGIAGAKAGGTCISTNHAAKEAAEAAGQAGLSTLKGAWNTTQKLARSKKIPDKKLQ